MKNGDEIKNYACPILTSSFSLLKLIIIKFMESNNNYVLLVQESVRNLCVTIYLTLDWDNILCLNIAIENKSIIEENTSGQIENELNWMVIHFLKNRSCWLNNQKKIKKIKRSINHCFEWDNVRMRTQLRIYGKILLESWKVSMGCTLGNSRVLRPYFTVYPLSSPPDTTSVRAGFHKITIVSGQVSSLLLL